MISQQAITLVMLVWGVYLIDQQVITGGALMGGVMFAMRAVAPLSSIVMLATRWQGARAAMQALAGHLDGQAQQARVFGVTLHPAKLNEAQWPGTGFPVDG